MELLELRDSVKAHSRQGPAPKSSVNTQEGKSCLDLHFEGVRFASACDALEDDERPAGRELAL